LGAKSSAPDELSNPSPLVSEDEGGERTDTFAGSGNTDSEASDGDYVPSGNIATPIRGRRHGSRSSESTIFYHSIPPDEAHDATSSNINNSSSTSSLDHGEAASQGPPTKTEKTPTFLGSDDTLDEPLVVRSRKALMEAKAELGHGGKYVPDVGEPGAVKKKRRHLGGKGRILNEDGILQVAAKAESNEPMGRIGVLRRLDTRKP